MGQGNVDIYLRIESTNEWIHALSIPRKDIKRLTLRPLKWLRFVTFTVCGAKGHLSADEGGATVDYESVSLNNGELSDRYYYHHENEYHLVDRNALNGRFGSIIATPRRARFRDEINERDCGCIITRTPEDEGCQAAHIIPKSKWSSYITFVVEDRSALYEQLSSALQGHVDINCIENGMLLTPNLHALFDLARNVFLKTPNFAMTPADVPRVEEGPVPENRTTLQYIVEPASGIRSSTPPYDVQAEWQEVRRPPPSILLDFVYGAAVVKHWIGDGLSSLLDERYQNEFNVALDGNADNLSDPENDEPDPENNESAVKSDDSDSSYQPSEVGPDDQEHRDRGPSRGKQKTRKMFSSDASAGLLKSMDRVLLLSMLLKGTTPQKIAAEREKRRKEERLRSRERTRESVQQWLNSEWNPRNGSFPSEGTDH